MNVFILVFMLILAEVNGEYGVLVAENGETSYQFCASYALNNNLQLSSSLAESVSHSLVDLSWWDGCSQSALNASSSFSNSAIVALNGNCSIYKKAVNIYELNAAGIIIPSKNDLPIFMQLTSLENFTIAVVQTESFQQILSMGPNMAVKFYIPPRGFYWDFSYFVIFFIAFACVFLGAVWNKSARARLENNEAEYDSNRIPMNEMSREENQAASKNPPSFRAICCHITLYLAWITFLLSYVLLNYYFFQYMMYVNIAFFCVGATLALYWCLVPFIRVFPLGKHDLKCLCVTSMEIRESVWFIICVAMTIAWCVCIKQSWIWTIQNLLGMAICIALLSGVWRISSLKMCVIVQIGLFVYDIFMVFVTPLFTEDGKSVMERMVIGGGDASESLLVVPTVFQCPFLSTDPLSFCYHGYLILGYGDIIIPGLLISYCYDFAAKYKSSKFYFVSSLAGYCVGLSLTAIFVNWSHTAQPALLYLIPCCNIPVIIIALIRKEFMCMWNNHPPGYNKLLNQNGEQNYDESPFNQH